LTLRARRRQSFSVHYCYKVWVVCHFVTINSYLSFLLFQKQFGNLSILAN
jgi:hypothetical protein